MTPPPHRTTESYADLSPGGLLRRAVGSASVYTTGLVSIRGAEFLLLPLYWALLPPEDYGILAVAAVVSEFLRAVFGFGLPESISRFYYDWPEEERARSLGAVWTWSWLGTGVLAALMLLSGDALVGEAIRAAPFDPYLEAAVLVALTASLVQVPLMTLRILERATLYVAGSAATMLLSTGLAIYFIVGLDMGALGVLRAQAIAYGLMAVVYAFVMLRWARPTLAWGLPEGVLAFSLPLIPSKLLEATATVFDRFVLEKFVTLEELGIYHAARQVGRGVELLGYGLLTAWIPFEIRVLTDRPDDGRRVVARVASYFLFALLLAGVALAAVAPPVIDILDIDGYRDVVPLIPIAVLPALVLAMAHIVVQGYIIARKTQYAWLRSGSRLVTTIAAMLVLVPLWGVEGAFLAMALAALVMGLVGFGLSQHFLPIPFEGRRIAAMCAAAAVAAFFARAVDFASPMADLALGTALVAAFGLLVGGVVLDGSAILKTRRGGADTRASGP